ncbi:MAG: methionine--tRNA ligase [Verrucomicrobiales bacterium]|nr:methionine--tRNA ligase [Verrucomicrobiales bacterium]
MSERFYITTAIDYLNGLPHLGHAYEKVITDVIARSRRAMGESVFYLTGLDEHGQKVQQAAAAEGKEPQAYCDELSAVWRAAAGRLGLSNDDFIRTTESRHRQVVQAMLAKLYGEGRIYRSTYEGWYSTKEETFLTDKDRLPDGTFPAHYGEVTRLSETNYFFPLKPYQAWLIDAIETTGELRIYPEYRRNEVLGFLKNEVLEDLCISRPKARLSWGIPLPFDPDYVTYVWFDALTNYVSVPASLGDKAAAGPLNLPVRAEAPLLWPAVHVLGKDILKFHAVFWPIMLKASGLAVPRQILAHGWWQKDGEKLSKTTGNVVDPIAVIDEWGLDAFRYYVTRELDIGPDGNWTNAGFQARYQAELANGLGNLVNRSLKMLVSYRAGRVPAVSRDLEPDATRAAAAAVQAYREFGTQRALVETWELVTRANRFVEETAPFKLAKDPTQAARLDSVLYSLVEACRILAVLLYPVIPTTASRIYSQLGLSGAPDRFAEAAWGGLAEGHTVGTPEALFPRRDLAKG